MNPPDLVQELGQRLNLTGLTLNDGVCRLVFDRRLPIDIEDDGVGNLCFHSVIGSLPHEGRETILSTLLSAHIFGLETDGAVFGLHPKTHEIYLFRSIPVEALDVDGALAILERFTQQAENWRQKLETVAGEAATSAPAPESAELLPGEALRA
jgi:hypothetical protein